jgi:transposase-like protein
MARCREAVQVRQDRPFKGRQFTAEVILWARLAKGSVRRSRMEGQGEGVQWYLMFPISYRDLERMLLDRSVEVDHTTIFRWIRVYAAELAKRIRPRLGVSNGSWRVDGTCVKVKGR